MTRRGNNEGSIRERADGLFEARISLEGGKRKSVYGKTRAEVAKKMHELLHNTDQGIPVLDDRQTVKQYLESWYEMKRPTVKESTWRPYRNHIKLRLVPNLGSTPLAKLTAQQIQLMYARLINQGAAPKTVYNCHGVLHNALDDAVRMGVVIRNVADMVDPPRLRRYDFQILDADQFQRFLTVIRGDRFEALYILALSTGMREGECLALHWADLDLAQNALQVKLTVSETDDNRFTLAEPKTLYSRRRVLLTPLAVEALQAHWERQQIERANMGDQYTDNDLVFPNGFGGIMIPHNITKRGFKRLLAKAGLSTTLRFHDLRHTAATLLIAAGVPVKVVSEMLGHSSVTITLTTYAHVLPAMQQSAVAVMTGLLGGHKLGLLTEGV
jgi:integrase